MNQDRTAILQKYMSKKIPKNKLKSKPQLKIFDPDNEFTKSISSSNEDENPIFETPNHISLSLKDQKELLKKGFLTQNQEIDKIKNKWVSIQNKKSDSEKSESRSRSRSKSKKRLDSDSDNELKPNKEKIEKENFKIMKKKYKEALNLNQNDSDLSPARNNEKEDEFEEKEKIIDQKKKLEEFANQFKNAETVFRDKTGKIIDIKQNIEDKQSEILRLNEERIMEWGAGAVQKQLASEKQKKMKDLKNEKFANYEISKETEKKMMDNDRFGDPMLRMIEKDKKENADYLEIISTYKKCMFRGIPNRFGIEPGHRWDGVDRSNGYERKYLAGINQRRLEKSLKEKEHLKEM